MDSVVASTLKAMGLILCTKDKMAIKVSLPDPPAPPWKMSHRVQGLPTSFCPLIWSLLNSWRVTWA